MSFASAGGGGKSAQKELEVSAMKWVKAKKERGGEEKSVMTASEVAAEHGVPRNVFKTYLEKEVEESQACWGLPFTLLLVVSYAAVALTHDDAKILRAVEESLDIDIIDNANFAYHGDFMGHKAVEDVNSVADFWSWMTNGLVPLVFVQGKSWNEGHDVQDPWYGNNSGVTIQDTGVWLSFNRIVGGIRMIQERSENEQCKSHKGLIKVYDLSCVGGHGYELDPEIRAARFTANPEREQWLYVNDDLMHLQQLVWQLEKSKWLDRNTKKVEIAIPAYNGELGIHIMIYINFFFSRGGHIWKKLMPLSFTAQMHPYWYYWIGDFVWMFCVFYIFACECNEIWGVVKRKGVAGIKSEYLSVWNAFDWFSLVCAFTVMGMFGSVITMDNLLNESLAELKDPALVGWNSTHYTDGLHEHMELLERTLAYVNTFRIVMAAYPLIIILRLFKAYSAQPRLAMVTTTLATSAQELVEFGLVFISVFMTFTISGIVLFGREVSTFTTMPRAIFASFRIVIGDLMWDDISRIGRAFAFVWLALFMVVMVMLLLNMLLAIIMKHYVQAKDSAGNAQTLWSEAFQVIQRARDERAGRAVSMDKILTSVEKDIRALEALKAMEDEEDAHIEDDDEIELSILGEVMMLEDLQDIYREHNNGTEIGEKQALFLMEAAIEDFYAHNHSAIDMEEVLHLTHKVEYRTLHLIKMSKQLDKKNPCKNEIETMGAFLKDMEAFTDELRSERDGHRSEMDELRTLKQGLLLQMQTRQSLKGDVADGNPMSVNSLRAHGDISHYAWRMGSRYSDDPRHDQEGNDGLDRQGGKEVSLNLEDEHTDDPVAGDMGPLSTNTRQPRTIMDDQFSDD